MAAAPGPEQISADLLFRTLDADRGAITRLAKQLHVTPAAVTNWRSRGIPARQLRGVTKFLRMSVEDYLRASNQQIGLHVAEPPVQYTTEASTLLEDYLALPEALREFIARKTRDLRKFSDHLPPALRQSMRTPADAEAYRAWEREIELETLKLRAADSPAPLLMSRSQELHLLQTSETPANKDRKKS
jgi:hypothetical protein